MEWQEIEVDGRHTVKFLDLPYVPLTSPSQSSDTGDLFIGKKLGGVLRHGDWGWLAKNSVLQVVSLRNGQTISSYEFCESRGYDSCYIKCVEEIFPNSPEIMLLAVVLESLHSPGGVCSYVAVFSVELGKVLHNIELSLSLTCARFMEASTCRRSLLQNFDGCLAVGSEEGAVVLLDLNVRKLISIQNEVQEDAFVQCHIVDYCLPLAEIHRNFRQCQQDGIHFGLQMEVIHRPSAIKCILPIDLILGLAIGVEDGRLALYDLTELQIFYLAQPNPQVEMSALVKMDFLEPSDDPRACLFIWTLHENGENLHAVLHGLMYEKRFVDEEDSSTYFETFQAGSVRLQLPLEATNSIALACQAISSVSTHGEDDANCLCAISWLSVLEGKNKLIIFDLNQWYKEEMPFVIEYGKQPNYLAGYVLSGECCGLQTLLNPSSIAHFNSMQRFEEHFYPNSLSFESLLLHTEGCRRYNWEGAQNRVINLLRSSNAAIFLEPNFYFNEIIRTRLMPQFLELNINSTFSRNAKCETLLSAALEHNCVSLLRDCAKSWIDGSFMGNFSAATGLSLSTLTDWIWKRATCIKIRCNDLCKGLFEFGGYHLDSREQKELGFVTRQLKLLAELLKEILVYAKKQIPERVFNDLANKQNSLSMASNYQDILLWLLNIGLLPEASPNAVTTNANCNLIPYPYRDLKEFYKNKRSFYAKLNESFVTKKTGSCKLLFIDSLIDHVCKGNILHEYWLENEGNGLYPPNSLEAMLRVMLVPDLDYDNKCVILLYFFLDLNLAIDEEVYKDVVANFIKFPSVFKLSAPLIKTVQAFWNLDHDHYLPAVDEFISPFNKNQSYPQWQVELLIEVLLNQNAANLALRILESQPALISPLFKLNTLLANDLISEAFHFVRCSNDDSLMETFYIRCLRNGQFGVIRDLALSDHEGLILQNILKTMKTPGAESLHFVYLLQKSKYIEAVSYMEEMSNRTKGWKNSVTENSQMDTPNLVLSAFNTTMTPVTQGLTDVYFRIRNKIKRKEIDNQSPVPLSCQLIKQNANGMLGGIYHSSALSAHFATYYWGEMEEKTKQTKHLLNSNNAPFLRRPQIDTNSRDFIAKNSISYPQVYKVNEKRTLIESGLHENEQGEYERQKLEYKLNPKKKRRLIGQEIVNDLAEIMKTNKTLDSTGFTFGVNQKTEEVALEKNEPFDLLLMPMASKPKEIETAKPPPTEIQGILKTYAPDAHHRDPVNEEEKNLRFNLPSMETEATASSQTNTVAQRTKRPEENMEALKSLEQSPKIKSFARSVSVESNRSSSSKSEELFYSPLPSQNNSKLESPNLSIVSGPQPRKPLARLSVERSEKSLTPERGVKTAADATQYVSAFALDAQTRISARSSLERLNTKAVLSKESSNLAFVTAEAPLSETKHEELVGKATSSGFGSLSFSQATFARSKIDEFLPKESSSKVGENEPVKTVEPVKLSECTTVLGCLTNLDNMSNSNTASNLASNCAAKPSEDQKLHMLETTLGMSSYDISILESTSLQQAKSNVIVTEKTTTSKMEVIKEIEIDHDQSTEEFINKTAKEDVREVEDKSANKSNLFASKEESNDVCIVLSSSSSSLSTSSLQHQEDDYNETYNDSDKDEEDEEDDYGIDIVDYDREEEEYEYDNEDYERGDECGSDNEHHMEEDVYDDENFDIDQQMENSSVNEITEDIQLIEDSFSDMGQQHYDDSDDVKLVEDDISTDVIEMKTGLKETKAEEDKDVDKNTSNTDTSLQLSAKEIKNSPSNTSETHEEIAIDIRINEAQTEELNPTEKPEIEPTESGSDSNDKPKQTESLKLMDTPLVKANQEENKEVDGKENIADPFTVKSPKIQENLTEETKMEISSSQKSTERVETEKTEEETNMSKEPLEIKLVESIEKKVETKIEETGNDKVLEDESTEVSQQNKDSNEGKAKNTIEREVETSDGAIASKHLLEAEETEQGFAEQPKKPESSCLVVKTDTEVSEKTGEKSELTTENTQEQEKEGLKIGEANELDKDLKVLQCTKEDEPSQANADLAARRITRGPSVPLQTAVKIEESLKVTPSARRSIRAGSLQPISKLGDNEMDTPHGKTPKAQDTEDSEKRKTRGSSVPPGVVEGKISRRRSILLDAISEDAGVLDSPSAHTRLKSRLNSVESEVDTPSMQQNRSHKRTRRDSMTSQPETIASASGTPRTLRARSVQSVQEVGTPQTPKRKRRDSATSHPDAIGTPRSLRSRSVLTVQDDDTESISATPKTTSKKNELKRQKLPVEDKESKEQSSPKSDSSPISETSYSATRRLTRTQLAIMEKSAFLMSASSQETVATISPPQNKRPKSRAKRSNTATVDSDDAESVSSKMSTVSSVTGIKRRVTRSSLKEKDDVEDDLISVTSSVGSEKQLRGRRSKDKSSPNTTLSTIPENAPIEMKKRGRPAKH